MFASIIVPVFNSEKYLCSCLDSVLSQALKTLSCFLLILLLQFARSIGANIHKYV